MMLAAGHLIYFGKKVRVVYLGETKSGNNEDIKKFHIEGDPVIPIHWEFAAKIQKGGMEMVRKMEFNFKAMALRSTYKDCIK